MAKEATTPKTKHADRMILQFTKKYSQMYLRACKSWETNCWKPWFCHLFFFFLI